MWNVQCSCFFPLPFNNFFPSPLPLLLLWVCMYVIITLNRCWMEQYVENECAIYYINITFIHILWRNTGIFSMVPHCTLLSSTRIVLHYALLSLCCTIATTTWNDHTSTSMNVAKLNRKTDVHMKIAQNITNFSMVNSFLSLVCSFARPKINRINFWSLEIVSVESTPFGWTADAAEAAFTYHH